MNWNRLQKFRVTPNPITRQPLPSACAQRSEFTGQFCFPQAIIWDVQIENVKDLKPGEHITFHGPSYTHDIPHFMLIAHQGKFPGLTLGSENTPMVDVIMESTIPLVITYKSWPRNLLDHNHDFPVQSLGWMRLRKGWDPLRTNQTISGLIFHGDIQSLKLRIRDDEEEMSLSQMKIQGEWGDAYYFPFRFWLNMSRLEMEYQADFTGDARVYYIHEAVGSLNPYYYGVQSEEYGPALHKFRVPFPTRKLNV